LKVARIPVSEIKLKARPALSSGERAERWTFPCRFSIEINDKKEITAPWRP
jgi:hypothetical protein